jgi:hypothetical protein
MKQQGRRVACHTAYTECDGSSGSIRIAVAVQDYAIAAGSSGSIRIAVAVQDYAIAAGTSAYAGNTQACTQATPNLGMLLCLYLLRVVSRTVC